MKINELSCFSALKHIRNNTALQKIFLTYTNHEYDHFICFFGRWIWIWHPFYLITSRFDCTGTMDFCILLKSEKRISSASDLQLNLDIFLCIFGSGILKKHQKYPIMPTFCVFTFGQNFFPSKTKNIKK